MPQKTTLNHDSCKIIRIQTHGENIRRSIKTDMSEKEETKQISRRQFLRNAGIVVGGTAVGSSVLLAACGGEEVTKTVTKTVNVTTTTWRLSK